MINKRQRNNNRQWIEMKPIREKQLNKMLQGKPEDIPDIWRKLTY
jgi:hypothetical protein